MTRLPARPAGPGSALRTVRWPWWAAWGLLVASSAATTASLVLHWGVCRGSMLQGTVVRGYVVDDGLSDACLRRMDGGVPFPYPPEPAEQVAGAAELGSLAMALAALAWAVLVAGLVPRRWPAAVALLPSAVTLVLAAQALVAARTPDRDPEAYPSGWLLLLVEVGAFIALMAVWRTTPTRVVPLVIVLWGSTAFGFIHLLLDYLGMLMISEADWDTPPGTGAGTALLLLVAAATAAVQATRLAPAQPSDLPRPELAPSTSG